MFTENYGGVSLDDTEQFFYSLKRQIKEYYPMNEIPKEVKNQVEELTNRAQLLVIDGKKFLAFLNEQIELI